jgi:hypothetical protein
MNNLVCDKRIGKTSKISDPYDKCGPVGNAGPWGPDGPNVTFVECGDGYVNTYMRYGYLYKKHLLYLLEELMFYPINITDNNVKLYNMYLRILCDDLDLLVIQIDLDDLHSINVIYHVGFDVKYRLKLFCNNYGENIEFFKDICERVSMYYKVKRPCGLHITDNVVYNHITHICKVNSKYSKKKYVDSVVNISIPI